MSQEETQKRAIGRLTLGEYLDGIQQADVATLARALTLVESNKAEDQALSQQLLERLMPLTGQSIRVGISGVPGVGKSTFIEALGVHLTNLGLRVAVLAVDPSSGLSGGSILGDKTRMPKLSAKANAFIRPAPSSGNLGGVAIRTRECMLICEAAGYDVTLIETVGVGQSETVVADMVDCFTALMLPGAGDELQAVKRGILELVDVIVVNKADGDTLSAAKVAAQQFETTLESLPSERGVEGPPAVLSCSALNQEGIDQVWQAITNRVESLKQSGTLSRKRGEQNLRWMWELVERQLRYVARKHESLDAVRCNLEGEVVSGNVAPAEAAGKLIAALGMQIGKGEAKN